MTKQFDIKKII